MNLQDQQTKGASHLLLIILVVIIISMIMVSLQIFSFLQTNQVSQLLATNKAFFGAEGAMYETLQHLRNDENWPAGNHLEDEYFIDGTKINRTIDELGASGELKIEITATFQGAKRKLVAEFSKSKETRPPLDVILVLDRSTSMGSGPGSPLEEMKTAAKTFVNYDGFKDTDRIGLVTFSYAPEEDLTIGDCADGLTNLGLEYLNPGNETTLISEITNIETGRFTNIPRGLWLAQQEFLNSPNPSTVKVVLVFSDGAANRESTNSEISDGDGKCWEFSREIDFPGDATQYPTVKNEQYYCQTYWILVDGDLEDGNPCMNPGNPNGYLPLNDSDQPSGTYCTDDTIKMGKELKNDLSVEVFSVFLSNITVSDCGTDLSSIDSSTDLGRRTLLATTSDPDYFYQTADESHLEEIFKKIAKTVTSLEFLRLHEAEPQPD